MTDTPKNTTRERLPGTGSSGRRRSTAQKEAPAPDTKTIDWVKEQGSDSKPIEEPNKPIKPIQESRPTKKPRAKALAKVSPQASEVAAELIQHERAMEQGNSKQAIRGQVVHPNMSYEEAWKMANEDMGKEVNRGSYADANVTPLMWSWDAKNGEASDNRRMARMAITSLLSALIPAGLVYAAAYIGTSMLKVGSLAALEYAVYAVMAVVLALSISGLKWGLARILHMSERKALMFAVVIDLFAFGAKVLDLVDTSPGSEARKPVYHAIMALVMVVNIVGYWAHNYMSARKRAAAEAALKARARAIHDSARK